MSFDNPETRVRGLRFGEMERDASISHGNPFYVPMTSFEGERQPPLDRPRSDMLSVSGPGYRFFEMESDVETTRRPPSLLARLNQVSFGKVMDVSHMDAEGYGARIVRVSRSPRSQRMIVNDQFAPPISSDNAQAYTWAMNLLGPNYFRFADKFSRGDVAPEMYIEHTQWQVGMM